MSTQGNLSCKEKSSIPPHNGDRISCSVGYLRLCVFIQTRGHLVAINNADYTSHDYLLIGFIVQDVSCTCGCFINC